MVLTVQHCLIFSAANLLANIELLVVLTCACTVILQTIYIRISISIEFRDGCICKLVSPDAWVLNGGSRDQRWIAEW